MLCLPEVVNYRSFCKTISN